MFERTFDRQIKAVQAKLEDLSHRVLHPSQRAETLAEALHELNETLEELHVAVEELQSENEILAENRLSLEEESFHYRQLFEFAPDAYLLTGPDGVILDVNRVASVLLQRPKHLLIDKPLALFVAPEERKSFLRELTRLRHGRPRLIRDWEIKIQPTPGPRFPGSMTVVEVPDAEGGVAGFRWVLRDVTERKRMEEALAAAEAKFRAVVETSTDGIVLLDSEGRVLYASPSADDMLGYERGWGVGENLLPDLIHPNDLPAAHDLLRASVDTPGRPFRGVARVRHADGTWRYIEGVVANHLDDPNVRALVVNFRDVTSRTLTEKRLAQAEMRYRGLVEQIPLLSYVMAAGGEPQVAYVSPRVADITGFPEDAWLADPGLWASLLHPEDRSRVAAERARHAATGRPLLVEYRMLTRDGAYLRVEEVARTGPDEGGGRGSRGVVIDVTSRPEAGGAESPRTGGDSG